MTNDDPEVELLKPAELPRGGLLVQTSKGPIQFGIPPETIKDSMVRPHGVPNIWVLTQHFFSFDRGISFAEMEFPIYFNFFVAKKKVQVVGTVEQKDRLFRFMHESMFGPRDIDIEPEIDGLPEDTASWRPHLRSELDYFRRHPFDPTRPMRLHDVIDFHLFDDNGSCVEVGGLRICRQEDESFLLYDPDTQEEPIEVPGHVTLPPRTSEVERRKVPFEPPVFGVTILGSGHGFDPKGKTTGFILWVNGRGIMVDPPVDTTEWMRQREVPARCVDSIILTHCHGDHDAGSLQKALHADRVKLYTTHTIYQSFLRKSSAITGLEEGFFEHVMEFTPLPIRRPIRINGARFVFNYTLHSIPTIGFKVRLGGSSLVYSSDTLNDPEKIRKMRDEGVLTEGRAEDLLDFPWQCDLIIHEAGNPPLHTPPEVLAKLSPEIKKRLYLVHTTQGHIPEGKGLKLAPDGLKETLQLETPAGEQTTAVSWLTAMRSVEFFRYMPVDKATEFLEIVQPITFEEGDIVIRKGEPGRHFFMILAGKAEISGDLIERKVFRMYDYFGEAALILDGVRTADVEAISQLKVLAMEKEDFVQFLHGSDVIERMRRLSQNRDFRTGTLFDVHPILQSTNAAQRSELQSFMQLVEVEEGEVLVKAQEEACPGFLVADGEIEEVRGGYVTKTHLSGSLVTSIECVVAVWPAQYTLRAAKYSRVFRLDNEPFRRFLYSYPGLYLRFLTEE